MKKIFDIYLITVCWFDVEIGMKLCLFRNIW